MACSPANGMCCALDFGKKFSRNLHPPSGLRSAAACITMHVAWPLPTPVKLIVPAKKWEAFTLAQKALEEGDPRWLGNQQAHEIMPLAKLVLEGEVKFKAGNTKAGLNALKEAVALEEKIVYAEPAPWMMPARHAYGALLIADGHPKQFRIGLSARSRGAASQRLGTGWVCARRIAGTRSKRRSQTHG